MSLVSHGSRSLRRLSESRCSVTLRRLGFDAPASDSSDVGGNAALVEVSAPASSRSGSTWKSILILWRFRFSDAVLLVCLGLAHCIAGALLRFRTGRLA